MKPVDQLDIDQAPEVTLGRKKFKICELVPRQNRIVTPAIFDLMEVFIRMKMASDAAKASGGDLSLALIGLKISETQYSMLLKVVHIAISRAHPDVTMEDLDELPIKTIELLGAFTVVAKQAGMIPESALAAGGADPLGATAPAAPTSPPTGEPLPLKSPSEPDGSLTTS